MGLRLVTVAVATLALVMTSVHAACSGSQADFIVVGAGLSGMTAALRLNQAGKCVIVLEADTVTGGLCRNWALGSVRDYTQKKAPVVGTNVQVSVGGSFYDNAKEVNLVGLFTELGLASLQYPPFNVTLSEQPGPLLYPPPFLTTNPADYAIFGTMYGIGAQFPDLRKAPPSIQALQNMSIDAYLATAFPSIPSNATAKELIRDWAAFYFHNDLPTLDAYTTSLMIAQTVTFNGESFINGPAPSTFYQLSGGTGQLTAVLEQKLKSLGVKIVKSALVTSIDSRVTSKIVVKVKAPKKKILKFIATQSVIMAAATTDAGKITYLPALNTSTAGFLKTGTLTFDTIQYQVYAFFRYPWWIGLSTPRTPVILPTLEQYAEVLANRKTLGLNLFGYTAPLPPLIVDQAAAQGWGVMRIFVGRDYFKSKPTTLRADVLKYLEFFGYPAPDNTLMDVKVFDWSVAHTSHTGYQIGGLVGKNLDNNYMQVNGGKEGAIVFASSYSAPAWATWLEGAVLAGNNAAKTALAM